jgi:hypothetical protein
LNFFPGQMAIAPLSHETFLIKVRLDMHLILRLFPVSAHPASGLAPHPCLLHLRDPFDHSTTSRHIEIFNHILTYLEG